MNTAKEFTATQAQLANKLIMKLDDVEFSAIMCMMQHMIVGASNEAAFAAANEILVDNGRDPLPYPPIEVLYASNSTDKQREASR